MTKIGTTILTWKFDEKNGKIKINKSKNTQKNNKKLSMSLLNTQDEFLKEKKELRKNFFILLTQFTIKTDKLFLRATVQSKN